MSYAPQGPSGCRCFNRSMRRLAIRGSENIDGVDEQAIGDRTFIPIRRPIDNRHRVSSWKTSYHLRRAPTVKQHRVIGAVGKHESGHFCIGHSPAPTGASQASIEDDEEGIVPILCHTYGCLRVSSILICWGGLVRIVIQHTLLHHLRTSPNCLRQLRVREYMVSYGDVVTMVKSSCQPITCFAAPDENILTREDGEP